MTDAGDVFADGLVRVWTERVAVQRAVLLLQLCDEVLAGDDVEPELRAVVSAYREHAVLGEQNAGHEPIPFIVDIDSGLRRSALKRIIPFLPSSLEQVAPENADHLLQMLRGVTLRVSPVERFELSVVYDTIVISVGALGAFWLGALAHWCLHEGAKGKDPRSPINAQEAARRCINLLRERYNLAQAFEGLAVPLPASISNSREAPDVASELVLFGLAYVLHHELAHLRLGHVGDNRAEEWAADEAALDFCVGSASDTDQITKRMAGIISAKTLIAVSDWVRWTELGQGSETHPPGAARLRIALDRYAKVFSPEKVWPFACTCLIAHADQFGMIHAPSGSAWQHFRDAVMRGLDYFSQC